MPSGWPNFSPAEAPPATAPSASGHAPAPPSPLHYASPGTVHAPLLVRTWQQVRASGPWWVRPSATSAVLVGLLIWASVWLAQRPRAWERVEVLASDDAHVLLATAAGKLVYLNEHRQPRLYDFASGRVAPLAWAETHIVFSWIEQTGDGRLLAGGASNEVRIWDGRSGALLGRIGRDDFAVAGLPGDELLAISPPSLDGTRIWTVTGSGLLAAWDITEIARPKLSARRDLGQAFGWKSPTLSPDGRHLLLVGKGAQAVVCDQRTLEARVKFTAPAGDDVRAAFTPDGRRLVVGSPQAGNKFLVQVIELAGGQITASFPFRAGELEEIRFARGSGAILLHGRCEMMGLYDADTGHGIWPRRYNVCWSPHLFSDERRLLTHVPFADHAQIVAVDSGAVLAKLPWFGKVLAPPDESRLVLAGHQNLEVWRQTAATEPSVRQLRRLWLFPSLAILLACSLLRDAGRGARRANLKAAFPARVVAAALLVTGCLALAYAVADSAVKSGFYYRHHWFSQPLNNALIVYGVFGVGLGAGGRGWLRATQALLLLSATITVLTFVTQPQEWHYEILDFIWLASQGALTWLGLAWAILAVAGAALLQSATSVESTPMPARPVPGRDCVGAAGLD